MVMAHHQIDASGPLPIQLAEPRVLVTVGVGLQVLHVQQLQRDTLAAQLPVHPPEIRRDPRHRGRRQQREQRELQRRIIKLRR